MHIKYNDPKEIIALYKPSTTTFIKALYNHLQLAKFLGYNDLQLDKGAKIVKQLKKQETPVIKTHYFDPHKNKTVYGPLQLVFKSLHDNQISTTKEICLATLDNSFQYHELPLKLKTFIESLNDMAAFYFTQISMEHNDFVLKYIRIGYNQYTHEITLYVHYDYWFYKSHMALEHIINNIIKPLFSKHLKTNTYTNYLKGCSI